MTKQQKRDQMRKECERLGIKIEPYGKGWRVVGIGVDLLITDLANLDPINLKPYLTELILDAQV